MAPFVSEHIVSYSDCDASGRLRISALLRLCQELAEKHSSSLGCGRKDLFNEYGLVWVITRNQFNIRRYPTAGEKVTLETYTAPARRVFYPRCFVLRDGEGRAIAESATLWVLVDVRTRAMTDRREMKKAEWDMGIPPAIDRFMAPPEPAGEEEITLRTAVYSDMDVNAHVNNTRFLDWLCDALGTQALTKRPVVSFLIDYHHEVREGQAVRLTLRRDEENYALTGHDESGTVLFSVAGAFGKGDA